MGLFFAFSFPPGACLVLGRVGNLVILERAGHGLATPSAWGTLRFVLTCTHGLLFSHLLVLVLFGFSLVLLVL